MLFDVECPPCFACFSKHVREVVDVGSFHQLGGTTFLLEEVPGEVGSVYCDTVHRSLYFLETGEVGDSWGV